MPRSVRARWLASGGGRRDVVARAGGKAVGGGPSDSACGAFWAVRVSGQQRIGGREGAARPGPIHRLLSTILLLLLFVVVIFLLFLLLFLIFLLLVVIVVVCRGARVTWGNVDDVRARWTAGRFR